MTCTCAPNSAFRWREHSGSQCGHHFYAYKDGRTASQIATAAVEKQIALTGRSPGSIHGISSAASKLIEEGNARRRASRG